MKKNIRLFILKVFIILIPFMVLMVYYYIEDPFMVLRKYDNYDKQGLFPNENTVGWNTYINNKDKVHYNSFILGNSCTMAFQCRTWQEHLNKEDRAIRLFGPSEGITAVLYKLKALEKDGANINNVLLIVDKYLLEKTEIRRNATYVMPPEVQGISNFEYQVCFAQAFLVPKFFTSYIDFSIFHHYRNHMAGIINMEEGIRDPITCDLYNPLEKDIANEKSKYWENRAAKFAPKSSDGTYQTKSVYRKEATILREINSICKKNNTNIKVVISPNYNNRKLNEEDLYSLKEIFGEQNVFDFSTNEEYSEITYYYDDVHYRPILGEILLQQIYRNKTALNRE